ncbi:MAG TPA: hypothetical protein VFP96_09655, partial [Candidatus Acidoferrum sp.]|nr:hypothetical protein [Candidatus Acidoferrum sp.]
MRIYFRALAKPIQPQNRNFVFVTDIRCATADYFAAVQKTQADLKAKHALETELVRIPDDKLMEPKYVLATDVDIDEHRIKIQNVHEASGIATWSDELLTDLEPGVTTYEGLYEILDWVA